MIRRRPLRRPPVSGRRPLRRPPLPPRVRRELVRANHLMADGQFADAAEIFGRLSEKARQRGLLVRAGDLALQASRAHFSAGHVELAFDQARDALRLLVRGGRAGRAVRLLPRITASLREKGYDAEAGQLEQEAERVLGRVGLSLNEVSQRLPPVAERSGTLPARCSGCGAPLVPDEVEWHDACTAECLYCGSIVKTT